jgi:hypothetical protein
MQSKGMVIASTALGAALLIACSSSKRGEDSRQAQSGVQKDFGSADQPNDCGSYTGDATGIRTDTDGAQFGGDITSADSPAQNGWFGPPLTDTSGDYDSHSCDTPNPTSTVRDQGRDIHYNEIFLKNWTDADACISVWGSRQAHLDAAMGWQVAAYVGAFDPNDIAKNNVGAWMGGVAHFAFKVPANATFEIVVMAEAPYVDGTKVNDVRVHWGLNVANCGEQQGGGGGSSSGGSSSGGSSSGGSSSGGST